MQQIVAAIFVLILLTVIGFMMKATFYRWWLCSLIQLDPRYQYDPRWRRAADRALLRFKENSFALQERVIESIPHWVKFCRPVVIGGVIADLLILFNFHRLL